MNTILSLKFLRYNHVGVCMYDPDYRVRLEVFRSWLFLWKQSVNLFASEGPNKHKIFKPRFIYTILVITVFMLSLVLVASAKDCDCDFYFGS